MTPTQLPQVRTRGLVGSVAFAKMSGKLGSKTELVDQTALFARANQSIAMGEIQWQTLTQSWQGNIKGMQTKLPLVQTGDWIGSAARVSTNGVNWEALE